MCTICLTAQFRLFAAASSNFEVALRYTGFVVMLCVVFGGYVLSVDKMIADVPWVGWIAVCNSPQGFQKKANMWLVYYTGAIHI